MGHAVRGVSCTKESRLAGVGVWILSTAPTAAWVLLGSGKFQHRVICGTMVLQLVCRRTLPMLAGTACDQKMLSITTTKAGGSVD